MAAKTSWQCGPNRVGINIMIEAILTTKTRTNARCPVVRPLMMDTFLSVCDTVGRGGVGGAGAEIVTKIGIQR